MKLEAFEKGCNLIRGMTHDTFLTIGDRDHVAVIVYEVTSPYLVTNSGVTTMCSDQAQENQRSKKGCASCSLFEECDPESTFIAINANFFPAQLTTIKLDEDN